MSMRKILAALSAAALMSVLVAPAASANECDPKLQGVCNTIHSVRCTADQVLTAVKIQGVDIEPRFCTI
jgi:hypothetical protein